MCLLTAEKLREIATRQGVVPFLKGDLRKSHVVQPVGSTNARVGTNLPYARAVHDGRPALLIRPKKGKALFFAGLSHPVKVVRQPARVGRPWLRQSVTTLAREGLSFLAPIIGPETAALLQRALSQHKLKATIK
ncbi:MAG: hypothetical protein H7Z12_19845 [Rhodospirillaceae bacterium]|nr:hypothetical protein [Rhodospirillales bacterium]